MEDRRAPNRHGTACEPIGGVRTCMKKATKEPKWWEVEQLAEPWDA
ncbi:hypothetical protein GCM10027569_71160 [Flindersiella endophytica]